MRYKLSDGTTGTTNFSKEEFEEILLEGISIVEWYCEDKDIGEVFSGNITKGDREWLLK